MCAACEVIHLPQYIVPHEIFATLPLNFHSGTRGTIILSPQNPGTRKGRHSNED
jgi:hypothetical protein